MILTNGKSYSAEIRLGFFDRIASNEMIKAKLQAVGFVNVTVSGDGRDRTATGIYNGITSNVDLPSQVSKITVN